MGQMLKVFLKTVVQSNADVAASQDMVVAATTNLAASRMDGINSLAGDTSVTLNQLRSAIVCFYHVYLQAILTVKIG